MRENFAYNKSAQKVGYNIFGECLAFGITSEGMVRNCTQFSLTFYTQH